MSKKPVWKGYILYDFNNMTSGKGKTTETARSCLPRVRDEQAESRGFLG